MNCAEEIDSKNCILILKIKLDEKSNKNILIYYSSYKTITTAKPLYLIINKINGHIEKN